MNGIFLVVIILIVQTFGQSCNGILKETSRTCCLSECKNPKTNEGQCGGDNCANFLSHLEGQNV